MNANCHPQPVHASSSPRLSRRQGQRRGRQVAVWTILIALLFAGCRKPENLEVTYGQRRGTAANSVNGTSVLASMFERAGFRAFTWRYLSPRLHDYGTIVWTPDDFALPSEQTQAFFAKWLESGPDKTLVFIGRDYDATSDYWDSVFPTAPADQQLEIVRRLAQARSAHDRERLQMPTDEQIEWFSMRRDKPVRRATDLHGEWCQDIDVSQTRISTRGLLEIPTEKQLLKSWKNQTPASDRRPRYTALLQDGEATLVTRVTKSVWGQGKVIVVTNGSFLLNLPLVNRQHRRLAMKLIHECEPAGKVAFLESGPGGPLTFDYEPNATTPEATRKRVLLAVHWFVLGLLYCFCVFPIFGRPKSTRPDPDPEFVHHVDALAKLLEKTRDEQYVRRQLDQYREGMDKNPTRAASRAAGSRTPLEEKWTRCYSATSRHRPRSANVVVGDVALSNEATPRNGGLMSFHE